MQRLLVFFLKCTKLPPSSPSSSSSNLSSPPKPQKPTMFHHIHSPDSFGRISNPPPSREKDQNMENHGDHFEGRIEFRVHVEEEGGETSDVASPPMWKRSSPPTENLQLQNCHYKSYHLLSPLSRSQAISRGQQELMNMIKDMPESSYELSLRDIVEQPLAQKLGLATAIEGKESYELSLRDTVEQPLAQKLGIATTIEEKESGNKNVCSIGSKKRKNWSKMEYEKKKQVLGLGSMSNEPFLLSMLFPTSWGLKNKKNKKKNSKIGPCSKFTTRPKLNLSIDNNWWKKSFSVAGGNANNGSESTGKSSGSNNSISRKPCDLLPGCLSIVYAKVKAWDRKAAPFEGSAM